MVGVNEFASMEGLKDSLLSFESEGSENEYENSECADTLCGDQSLLSTNCESLAQSNRSSLKVCCKQLLIANFTIDLANVKRPALLERIVES